MIDVPLARHEYVTRLGIQQLVVVVEAAWGTVSCILRCSGSCLGGGPMSAAASACRSLGQHALHGGSSGSRRSSASRTDKAHCS
jgi:hypothetical protein